MKIAWLVIAAGLVATPVLAASPQELCKGGQLVLVRVSKLKTPEARAAFDKAAKDNEAWYRSHGITTNEQVAGSVLVVDPATHEVSVSPDTVATLHVNPPGHAAPAPDAAWKTFVDEYDAASEIQTQTMICLERPIH